MTRSVRSRIFALFLTALLLAVSIPSLAQNQKPDSSKNEKKDEELPLKTASTIDFTTDEGTWMSLDLSPDGQTIVFDLLGDIYTLPVSGGEAKRIIGGLSFESQPKFSPDGKQIVYISDKNGCENLWVANADGSNQKLITSGRNQLFISPSWTPDGEYIVASKAQGAIGTYVLWLYGKDGGTGVALGAPPKPAGQPGGRPNPENKMGAVTSPDGRYVYYAQRNGSFSYNMTFPAWQVHRFDRENGVTAQITNSQGSAMRPLISPDGKYMVYATRFELDTALRVRNLQTGDERWLIRHVTRDDQESRATRDTMPGYSFTPDGKSLIVPIDGKIKKVDFETGAATDIPFTAKVQAEIAARTYFQHRVDESPMVRARLIRWPQLSPDGSKLAFGALNKIWIMDYPSGTPKRLTNSDVNEFMPTWSPDGNYIAFVTWSENGGQLQRVSPSGGSPETLSSRNAFYRDPVYSPDGSKIVFVTGSSREQQYSYLTDRANEADVLDPTSAEISGVSQAETYNLSWMPASGGSDTAITVVSPSAHPHFAASSDRVYMYGGEGLKSVRLDGSDERVHIKVTGTTTGGLGETGIPAGQIRVSPDGQRAFVDLQDNGYIVMFPKTGKDPIEINITPGGKPSVPMKKMSAEGGDYLQWTPDGKAVTWGLGSKFYRQTVSADKPDVTDITVEKARYTPKGTVLLRGARIVTMKGDEVIERGDLLIKDNRIEAVGARGKVTVPLDAKIIDVTGKTIIPGFVDVHSHMWPPHGVNQTEVWQYLVNLAYGVTTTRDPQSSTNDVFAYTDLVDTGDIIGPRIYSTGPGVFAGEGVFDKDSTRNFIKRYRDAYHTDTLKEYMTGDRIVRQWVIMACKEFGITSTTEGGLDIKLDLSQMADGFSGSEHALPIHPLYKDVAEFVAKTGTFYTPTIIVAYGSPWSENYYFENTDVHGNMKLRHFIPHEILDTMVKRRGQWFMPEEYGHEAISNSAAKVVRAGGHVCLGSHGQMQGLGAHWELWNIQSGGMTPLEAIRCATLFGAQAIGLQQDVGSLEPGKLADLMILDKNPLDDIHNTNTIKYVMKDGEMFEGDTMNEVWPEAKPLGKMYWWDQDPK